MKTLKQNRYDADGLNALAIEVMKQAYEDLNYYPQPKTKKVVDENGNTVTITVPVSEKTLREAEKIRKDAEGFLNAMKERYAG